jgi:polysaccharide biosynthesis protein PslH
MNHDSLDHKRILLVSPFPPSPPTCGAYQRTYFLWKALSEIAPVDLVLCSDTALDSTETSASRPVSMNLLGTFTWQSKAQLLCRSFGRSTFSLTLERLVRVTLPRNWDYEVDHGVRRSLDRVLDHRRYFLAVGRYLKPIIKTGLVGKIPCVLDIDDVDFDIFAQRAQDVTRSRWERYLYSAQTSQIKAAFEKWLPQFHGLWVTKASDRRYAVTRSAAILPNIPYNVQALEPRFNGSGSTNPVILTVGVLNYLPNREGIDRFIREGWPKVRAACPTAQYWLVGKNDPAAVSRWQAVPGVKVLGYVDNLAAVYEACWFTLCPLWSGGGTNITVLESLAYGRTCVATGIGHRGFEGSLQAGDSLIVAEKPEELADDCVRLINDGARRLALSERGQEVVRREFSYEKFANVVHREIERAVGARFLSSVPSCPL